VPALWGERAADGSRSGGGKGERRRRAVAAEVCSSGAEREGSEAAPESHIPFPRLACLIGGCVAGRAAGAGVGGGWLALSGPPPLLLVCSLLEDEMGWAGPATCANFGSGPHTTKLLPFFFGHHKTSSFINHTPPCMSALVCWKHHPW